MINLTRLLLVIGLSLTLGACGSDDTVSVTDETGGTSSVVGPPQWRRRESGTCAGI